MTNISHGFIHTHTHTHTHTHKDNSLLKNRLKKLGIVKSGFYFCLFIKETIIKTASTH
jgi:hypothetical protein